MHDSKYLILTLLYLGIFSFPGCDMFEIEPEPPEYAVLDEFPSWNPKEDIIAFHRFKTFLNTNSPIDSSGLYLVNDNGSEMQRIAHRGFLLPDWSSNGKMISVTDGNIFIINSETYAVNQITTTGNSFFQQWLPGDTVLVYNRSGDIDTVGTWLLNTKSLAQKKIGSYSMIDWSISGKLLFTRTVDDGKPQIFVADSLGGQVRQLTNNGLDNLYPKWSPDEQKITWTIGPKSINESGEIWLMDCNGENQKKLTNGVQSNWAPDGKKIVFCARKDDNQFLYILCLDNGEIFQLTK